MKDDIIDFFYLSVFVVPIVIFFGVFIISKKKLSLAIFLTVASTIFLSTFWYIVYIGGDSIIDLIGNIIFFSSFCIPVVVFWSTIVKTKGRSLTARLFSAFSFSIASFIFSTTLWFAICFRDGLGPGASISTKGSEALIRSIEELNIYWIIFSFAFFFLGLLGFFLKKISSVYRKK